MNSHINLGPRPHGIYSDWDFHGNPRIAVTRQRKGKRGGLGLKVLTGTARNIAFPFLSAILHESIGQHLSNDADGMLCEYHAISESTAIHMMLLMEAIRSEPNYVKSIALAEAVVCMNDCEANWWYAHHRYRPRKVMKAMALMHT